MFLIAIGILALSAAGPAFGDESLAPGGGSFETEAFYSQASYVGGIREDVSGLELRWVFHRSRWSLRAALPLLTVSNGSQEASSAGPNRGAGSSALLRPETDQLRAAAGSSRRDAGDGVGGRGADRAGGPTGSGRTGAGNLTGADRATGAGDLRLEISRRLGDTAAWHSLSLRGGFKAPTGDEERALGSGEADYWAGISWRREGWIADLSAYLDYVRLGDPAGLELRDGPSGGILVEWPFDPRGLFLGAVADHPVIEGDSIRLSGVAGFWGSVGRRIEWSFEASVGLTESAPDLGISVTMGI